MGVTGISSTGASFFSYGLLFYGLMKDADLPWSSFPRKSSRSPPDVKFIKSSSSLSKGFDSIEVWFLSPKAKGSMSSVNAISSYCFCSSTSFFGDYYYYYSGRYMTHPRSPILATFSLSMKMFRDLRSLWTMFFECKYWMPRQRFINIFQIIFSISGLSKTFYFSTTELRSPIMQYSRTILIFCPSIKESKYPTIYGESILHITSISWRASSPIC